VPFPLPPEEQVFSKARTGVGGICGTMKPSSASLFVVIPREGGRIPAVLVSTEAPALPDCYAVWWLQWSEALCPSADAPLCTLTTSNQLQVVSTAPAGKGSQGINGSNFTSPTTRKPLSISLALAASSAGSWGGGAGRMSNRWSVPPQTPSEEKAHNGGRALNYMQDRAMQSWGAGLSVQFHPVSHLRFEIRVHRR
jgi:hypothetical protein